MMAEQNKNLILTDSELNLIYELVCKNSEWKEDEKCKDHDSIIDKIYKLRTTK